MSSPPTSQPTTTAVKRFPTWQMLGKREFRLLWMGQSVSILGDQFYLVALPWLVLHITGSALALGTVLLTATVARVVFQLVGGATSDLASPRKMMIASSAVRAVVCAILSVLVLSDRIRLWQLFIIVAIFGTADAFFVPAIKAFIPTIIDKDKLVSGNSLLNGSSLLAMFIGPSLAGLMISFVGTGGSFAIDTFSFLFVIVCLLLMRPARDLDGVDTSPKVQKTQLWGSIVEGIKYTWSQPTLRALLIITGLVEFAFAGPFTVGLATLANVKFAGGATAFGAMLSSLGAGLLLGTLVVGGLHAKFNFGKSILMLTTGLAVGLAVLGFVPNVIWACVVMVLMGVIAGYLQVLMQTWLQTKSDPKIRGRVISVVMLSAYGLTPLSYVLTGALTQISISFMFRVTGLLLLLALSLCAFGRSGRSLVANSQTA